MDRYTYMQVEIWNDKKLLGKVRFEPGEGNQQYYMKRADILSTPYLFQDIKHLTLDFRIKKIKSDVPKLTEVFIPTID